MTIRTHEDMTDEQALDEYLKGGSPVSQQYRASAGEVVPPELDRRVIAMARESAVKPTRLRASLRWTAPLAVAASAVLALSIVLDQGAREQAAVSTIEPAASPAPQAPVEKRAIETPDVETQAAPPPPAVKTESPRIAAPEETASRFLSPEPPSDAGRIGGEVQARALRKRIEREDTSMRRSEDLAAAAPAPRAELDQVLVTGQSPPPASTSSIGAASTVVMEAPQSTLADVAHSDPTRWLEEIRALREQGKNEEADREWDRFREAFPDYAVPDSDRARRRED